VDFPNEATPVPVHCRDKNLWQRDVNVWVVFFFDTLCPSAWFPADLPIERKTGARNFDSGEKSPEWVNSSYHSN